MTLGNAEVERRPSILGIWRLGRVLHVSDTAELCLAQPADAPDSPRWDYVVKRGLDVQNRPANRQGITQAALVSQSVSHPNLVCVLDGSVSGEAPHLVMPRIVGATIEQLIERGALSRLPLALWLTRQAAQALEALHAGGWIHGDVKPANLMINDQGHVTLVDLGFARRVHSPLGKVFRGTPRYASPEQLEGETAALPAMDMFSLGRVLWQLLAQLEDVCDESLVPVAEWVGRMIDVDPQRRPTASETVGQLLRLEIETLGRHIVPNESPQSRAA